MSGPGCGGAVNGSCAGEALAVADSRQCGKAGFEPPPGGSEVTLTWLAHLYLCEKLSTYRIAALTGLGRQRVAGQLRQQGVLLRARGGGGTRPDRRRDDPPGLPDILAELYVRRRLTTPRIGAILGIPDRTVRDRLHQYGIKLRTKGRLDREDRRVLPAEAVEELYVQAGLTAQEVGRKLGASRGAVLRAAHEVGLPVRAGGAVPRQGPAEIELVNALYTDALVAATLTQHQIPRVPAGGPAWERFPEPVPLTRQLVVDLYWCCGVGLAHIELLTGQPAQTVGGFMRRAGIPVRHPGGRSPFIRRWRAGLCRDNCPSPDVPERARLSGAPARKRLDRPGGGKARDARSPHHQSGRRRG